MRAFFHNRPLGKTLLGLLLFGVGLVVAAFLIFNLGRDLLIWVFGRDVQAQVVGVWIEQQDTGESAEPYFRYHVRYQFTTESDELIVRTTTVGRQEWAGMGQGGPVVAVYYEQEHIPTETVGGLEEGGTVDVTYFPLYPRLNRLDDSRFRPVLACLYVPFLVVAGAGLAAGWHLLRRPGS